MLDLGRPCDFPLVLAKNRPVVHGLCADAIELHVVSVLLVLHSPVDRRPQLPGLALPVAADDQL